MVNLTVHDVDDDLARRLAARAEANRRSPEAEHRAILEGALRMGDDGFWRRAQQLREKFAGRLLDDSTALVREDRDR